MKRADFVFFDAGGGHRAAATALREIVTQQQRPWDSRLMNLQEVLDELDIFRRVTGVRMQDVYNKLLKRGWTLGSEYMVPAMHMLIKLYHPAQRRLLIDYWKKDTPDMVVSLIPNFNRALYQAIHAVNPKAPLVTILTDIADYPPHFWMERQDQHFICGSAKAVEQALAMGHPQRRVHRASGMILRPNFYADPPADRGAERQRLGLEPDLPTGIVLFGGQGSSVMLQIARRLQQVKHPLQFIFICGRNEKLAALLKRMPSKFPIHVVGFTSEVPYYMHLSDFFIGKPGPGSISEAVACKLAVIVERNAWTLPQERYNTEWVKEQGVGMVLDNFSHIASAVEELLAGGRLNELRARAAAQNNRAVFEIPDILETILNA